jgi:hypothetical protein
VVKAINIMSERYNPDEYIEFEEYDGVDPQLPTSGPLYELFSEMLRIAQNHSLTSGEIFELTFELHYLYKMRSYAMSEDNQHTFEEGAIMIDPLDQTIEQRATREEFYEVLDTYEPLLDGFSILVSREAEVGGRFQPELDPAETTRVDDKYFKDDDTTP